MANEFVIRAKIDTNPAKMQLNALKKDIAQKVKEINSKEIKLGDLKAGKTLTDEIKEAKKQVDSLTKDIERRVDQINNKKIRLNDIRAGKVLTDEIKDAQRQVTIYEREVEKASKRVDALKEKYNKVASEKIPALDLQVTDNSIKTVESKMKAVLTAQSIAFGQAVSGGIAYSTEDLERQQEQVNKAIEAGIEDAARLYQERLNEMIAANDRFYSSDKWLDLENKLNSYKASLQELRSVREELISDGAYTSGAETEQAKQIKEELDNEAAELSDSVKRLDEAKERVLSATSGAVNDLSDEIEQNNEELKELQTNLSAAKEALDTTTSNSINGLSDEIERSKEELESLKTEAQGVGGSINNALSFNKIVSGVSQIGSYITSIAGTVWQAGTAAASWIGNTVFSAVKTLTSGFISLGSSIVDFGMKAASVFGGWLLSGLEKIKDIAVSIGKAFLKVSEHLLGITLIKNVWGAVTGLFQRIMRLASLAFVFRVLTQWFRQLKNDVVDAFKTYLNYDSALNTSVNNLKNSFSTLKSQLASAFAPIIEIIVPYLTTFVNWCVTAANALSALIAALTGKTSWKKAVVSSVDGVSKGADTAADSLDNAADKAEELKEKLGSYDKLNVIQDDSNKKTSGSGNKGGGAGGSGGSGGGISYVDQSIGDKIKGLADWLKDMWDKADLSELGRKLGVMLRDALKQIPWDKIQEEAKKTADRICSLITGFVTTPGLAKELGNAVGQLIQTGIVFANRMVHKFPWKQTGKFLADGLNAAVKAIDFHMAGDTIATGLNGIMDLLNEFLDPKTGFDFSTFGKKIADFINTATTLDWERLGLLATNLGTAIATFVNELSAAEVLTHIGDLIGHFIEAAVSAFKTFIENTNFKDLGTDFGGFVKKIGDSISQALNDLSEINIAQKLQDFFDGLKSKIKKEDIEAWGTSIGTAFGSAIKGLATFLSNNKQAVYDALKSFVTGLTKGAGSAVTADTFKEVGKTLTTWLSNAIGDVSDWISDAKNQKEIKDRLLGFFQGLADGWNEGTLGKLGRGIKSALGIIATTVTTWISNNKDKIIGEVTGFVDSLLGNGDGTLDSEDFSGLGTKLNTLLNDVKNKISEWINAEDGGQAVVHNFATLFDNLIGNGDGALTFSDVWNFISEIFNWLNTSARDLFKGEDFLGTLAGFIFTVRSGLLGKFLDIGGGVAKKFVGGVVEGLGKKAVTNDIQNAVSEEALSGVGTAWGNIIVGALGIAVMAGLVALEYQVLKNGSSWISDRQDERAKSKLGDNQKKLYDTINKSGLSEGNNLFTDSINKDEVGNFLANFGTDDFDPYQTFLELINNTDVSLSALTQGLKDLSDQEGLTGIEQLQLNQLIGYCETALDSVEGRVTKYEGSLDELESTSNGISFSSMEESLNALKDAGYLTTEQYESLLGQLNISKQAGVLPTRAFSDLTTTILTTKDMGENTARLFAGTVKDSFQKVGEALLKIDVDKLKTSLNNLNKEWDSKIVGDYLDRISEAQKEGDVDKISNQFGDLLRYLQDNGASAKDLASILENTLGIKIDGTRSSVEKAQLALKNMNLPPETKAALISALDELVTKEDKVTEKSPEINPKVNDKDANDKIGGVAKKLVELGKAKAAPKADLDTTDGDKKAKDFSDKITGVSKLTGKGKLDLDDTDAKTKESSIESWLSSLNNTTATANLTVDKSGEETGLSEAEDDLSTYDGSTYSAKADLEVWDPVLLEGALQTGAVKIEDFENKHGVITIETDLETAQIDLGDEEIQRVLGKYKNGGQDVTITAKGDVSNAETEFIALDGSLDKFENKNITVYADGDTSGATMKLTSLSEDLVTFLNEHGEEVIAVKGDSTQLESALSSGELDISTFKDKNGIVIVDFQGQKVAFDTTNQEIQSVLTQYNGEGGNIWLDFLGDATSFFGTNTEVNEAAENTGGLTETVTYKGDNTEFNTTTEETKDTLGEVPDEKKVSFIDIGGAALAALATLVIKAAINSIPDEKKVTFKVDDQTKEPVRTIKDTLKSVQTYTNNTVLSGIKTDINNALSVIKTSVEEAMTGSNSVKSKVQKFESTNKTVILSQIERDVKQSLENIKTLVDTTLNGGGGIKGKVDSLRSTINSILTGIVGLFRTGFASCRDVAIQAISAIQRAINGLSGKDVTIFARMDNDSYNRVMGDINELAENRHSYLYIDIIWRGSTSVTLSSNWAEKGGVFKNGRWSSLPQMASGGLFHNGFWDSIPMYAGGTARAHGTMFIAGENGAEIVGNIGGRTEVLNKSQLAATMFSSVRSAMGDTGADLVNAIIMNMVSVANAMITNIVYVSEVLKSGFNGVYDVVNGASTLSHADWAEYFKKFGDYVNATSKGFGRLDELSQLQREMPKAITSNADLEYKRMLDIYNGVNRRLEMACDILREIEIANKGGNEMQMHIDLDGTAIYERMVQLDKGYSRITGISGFGG